MKYALIFNDEESMKLAETYIKRNNPLLQYEEEVTEQENEN